MSIVIVGGHDRMVAQYKKICKSYKCKCKVFTQMEADFSKKIGCPDLLVLFTNTVSHKMVKLMHFILVFRHRSLRFVLYTARIGFTGPLI